MPIPPVPPMPFLVGRLNAGPARVSLIRLMAHAWGTAVHCVIFSVGLILMMHATQVGATLSVDGHWPHGSELWTGLREALLMFLQNILLPFMEIPFIDVADARTAMGVDVWGLWVPGFFSAFFIVTASLGLVTLRRQKSWSAVPYALLAAVLLVWQSQAGHALTEISSWEDLNSDKLGLSDEAQRIQRHMFKVGHDTWAELYTEQQCKSIQSVNNLPRFMECSADTFEAQLMPIVVQEVCRPRRTSAEPEFLRRVKACRDQGRKLHMLPSAATDSDAFYCRCRSAVFDMLQVVSRWFMVMWLFLLAGVLAAIYTAAEPKLGLMCHEERREVLCFAAVSTVILAVKATLFADALPWAQSGAGLLSIFG